MDVTTEQTAQPKEDTKTFIFTDTLVNEILNYLSTRPLGEVLKTFDNMRAELSTQTNQ